MTLWSDIATWRGPVLHHSGTIAQHLYVVVHTASGSFEGTIAWQKNKASDNSSHFVVDYDGTIAQVNDTANRSGAQIDGNPYSIAIENAGDSDRPLTPAQVEANARILAKAHLLHGVPLQLTNRVGTPGLGHHSMGAESGVKWGHSACPGELIKAQKPAILARAVQIVNGVPATPTVKGDLQMFLVKAAGSSTVYLSDGAHAQPLSDLALFTYLRNAGVQFFDGVAPANFTILTTFAKDPAPAISLTDAQADAIGDKVAAALAARPDNPLGDADKPAIKAAVKEALTEGTGA